MLLPLLFKNGAVAQCSGSCRRFVPLSRTWSLRLPAHRTDDDASERKQPNLQTRSIICCLLCGALVAPALAVPATQADGRQAQIEVLHVPELDAGFHLLYELKPAEARAQFEAWQTSHPEDPLGSASEAAAYLFEKCYRQGVLTSEFFLDNKRFLGKIPLKPDPQLRAAFFAADKKAQDLAQLRLQTNPEDTNALFAMTLSVGMQADYASLIDKQQVESLKMIKDADRYAKKLLVVAPDAADAYLTLGAANYIIGSLPGYKKLFLGVAGIHGDKKAGIQQLEIAAQRGHYLRPFAKILLALAALREKQTEVARTQLQELVAEFPENSLFANELAKLTVPRAAVIRPWESETLLRRMCLRIRTPRFGNPVISGSLLRGFSLATTPFRFRHPPGLARRLDRSRRGKS